MRRQLPHRVLEEALAHFEVVAEYGAGDLTDQMAIDATCMRLSAGIEALSRLSAADRDALVGGVWTQIWGMRNRIAHGYLLVEPAIVRSTVDRDLPLLIKAVRTALAREERRLAAGQDVQTLRDQGAADDLDDLVVWTGIHGGVED